MAILAFATAIGMMAFLPETQYTRRAGQTLQKRHWVDNLRFWPASGGGPPKVHRQASIPRFLNHSDNNCSVKAGFVILFPFFLHPLILLNMTFFSLVLCVNSYLLVRPDGLSEILKI